jgi:DNA-binding IclR family transcriptional regulator
MTDRGELNARYPSFERIVDMWLAFVKPDVVLTASAIAQTFGTSRSSTYRYLQILRERGLIEDIDGNGNYRLASGFVNLVRTCEDPASSAAIAEVYINQLAAATGETALFTTRMGDRVFCSLSVESRQAVRVSAEPVSNTPLFAGSSAKVHLAYMTDAERARMLPRHRQPLHAATEPKTLEQLLQRIRDQGYAISDGEIEAGVRSVSAPAFFPSGALLGAVTIAAPAYRLQDAALKQAVLHVVAAARHITEVAAGSPLHRASAA